MHRLHRRTPSRRASLAAVLSLLAGWGCGGATAEPSAPPAPPSNPPERVVIVASPKTTGAPWDVVGNFSVRVENAAGEGVPGVRVRFTSQSGKDGAGFESDRTGFGPSDTTTTDATGLAWATVKLGTKAGPDQLWATAQGVVAPVSVNLVITPGSPKYLRISDYEFQLFQAGDSAAFQAYIVDGWNNVIRDAPFEFQVADPTLISVTPPAAQGGNGIVRALRSGGTTTIRSGGVEYSPTLPVRVFSSPRTACTGVASPQSIAVGALVTVADSAFCLAANALPSGYALMMYNGSTDGATSLGTTVTAFNAVRSMIPDGTPSLSRSATLRRSGAPRLDLRFHEGLLERSRSLRRLFAPARAVRSVVRGGSAGRIAGPRLSYSAAAGAATIPAVNDLIALNVADVSCTNADMRTFRVEAVGTRSIVLADTANPADGFTRADYQRFSARFDTLVYPLDIDAFGEPSDIDANERVAILFTRAVNELTPANADAYVGGFFHPRDLFPRAQSPTLGVCATSNEGELMYMMVPDPSGVVNGNRFSRGMVDTLTTGVLAHELQHLINASRRLYVNTAAQDFEETWLNEGLSHTAEELLYFRESGYQPRSRLTANSITDTWAHFGPWLSNDASNFVRFYLYLLDPANHSPLDPGDDLETRGATWAFLRFAVDWSYSSDGGVWRRFGNSTTTGVGTLAFGLQRDPKPLLRDFAVANMRGGHPSWDFVSVYTQVFEGGKYPLPFVGLQDGIAVEAAAKGGSASHYRFAIPANSQALLKFGSDQGPPSGNLTFMLVREY